MSIAWSPPVAPPAGRDMVDALDLDRLRPATLAEVLAAAELQTRVDRKYLLPLELVGCIVGELARTHHVLRIAGRLATSYSTVYFDSPEWQSFRDHAQGRRRRWKVRTRLYTEDLLCRLELKTAGSTTTVKLSRECSPLLLGRLDESGRAFLRASSTHAGLRLPVERLQPGVHIDYVRATLADLDGGTRVTVDGGLVGRLGPRSVRLREDHVLMETKGGVRPAWVDRLLVAHGVRPVSVSKYSACLAALEPWLPGARWRPVVRDYLR